jgi:polysaccharide biosynthesis PFTS motif protein
MLLLRHLCAPAHFIKAVIACRLNVLLGSDLAFLPLVKRLGDSGMIRNMVVTTSSFLAQPLWLKGLDQQRFRVHMLWYSQNFIPKMYVGDSTRPDLPHARHMRVDVHWVWTAGFLSYLRDLGQTCNIEVVGPILWYLPEPSRQPVNPDLVSIAIFDITPLADGATVFGAAKNYYSVKTISRFVGDIVKVCEEFAAARNKRPSILIKHKRAPIDSWHASSYLAFLEQLARERPGVEIISHESDLFQLLEGCGLSVSVPYTSTAYVAAALGKPAIYYDPFAELVPCYESDSCVFFASGPNELRSLFRRLMDEGANNDERSDSADSRTVARAGSTS